jgi:hypothetical protein
MTEKAKKTTTITITEHVRLKTADGIRILNPGETIELDNKTCCTLINGNKAIIAPPAAAKK